MCVVESVLCALWSTIEYISHGAQTQVSQHVSQHVEIGLLERRVFAQ